MSSSEFDIPPKNYNLLPQTAKDEQKDAAVARLKKAGTQGEFEQALIQLRGLAVSEREIEHNFPSRAQYLNASLGVALSEFQEKKSSEESVLELLKTLFQEKFVSNGAAIIEQALSVGIDAAVLQKVVPQEERMVQQALQRCQAMKPLEHGMSPLELFKTIIIIETELPKWTEQKTSVYLKANKVSRPRSIEYDPVSGNIYIHLKTKNVKMLGEGESKIVTRSLLYNAPRPEFAAQAITHQREPKEIGFLRQLNGKPGIVKVYGIREIPASPKKEKPARQGIMMKYYNGGTLSAQFGNKDLTTRQKEQIALGALTGLQALHGNNIVHQDFHSDQILIEFLPSPHGDNEETAHAVVTDFGSSFSPLHEPSIVRAESNCDGATAIQRMKQFDPRRNLEERERIYSRLLQENQEKAPRYFPGCAEYQGEVQTAGRFLFYLLVCGDLKIHPEPFDVERKRYEYEDAIKVGTLNPETMRREQKIEYLALRMMSLLRGVTPTAAQAHAELAAILAT